MKNFHKSKVDGLEKLPTRACLFYYFLHFKGCPYINHFFSGDFLQALLPYTVVLEPVIRADMHDENLSEKRRNAQKMAILTKKSKIFIKAKLTVSKSCLLGPACSIIFCILRGAYLQKVKYFKSPSYDFWNFSYAHLHWHSSNSFCSVS